MNLEDLDITDLTEEIGIELLKTEWKANGNKFWFKKGGIFNPNTSDGKIYQMLSDKIIAEPFAKIEQIRFITLINKIQQQFAS